jgi:hemolysin III
MADGTATTSFDPKCRVADGASALVSSEVPGVVGEMTKPRLRGRLHQAVFWLTLPAGAILVAGAGHRTAVVAAAIYVASMTLLFGTSAAYHRGNWSPRVRAKMQRADHAMIFVLIAGSYTPIALLALRPAWGVTLLAVAWTIAVAGVTLTLVRWDFMDRHGGTFYVAFGWVLVIALPAMVRTMSLTELVLLFSGGVLYTAGAVCFGLERPRLFPKTFGFHELWHVMTVLAAVCHYLLVLDLVRA